ncbi:MAG: arginine--tRNA ligase [Candidatus Omnitrophota bacterium]
MMKKHNPLEALPSLIKDYLRSLKVDNRFLSGVSLEIPPKEEYGDLSTSIALKLSKVLRRPPAEIAESLAGYINERIKDTGLQEDVASVRIAGGGFVNFCLTENFFRKVLKEIVSLGGDFGRSRLGRGHKILVEFVSANPTGPLSIAHARQAAVGDALCNILAFLGFSVKREYYLNDEGNQINLLGESIQARLKELLGEPFEFPEGGYEGEYIGQIAREILQKKPVLRLRSGLALSEAEAPESFSEYGVRYILRIIKQELKDFGIEFDYWYSQKQLVKSGKIGKVVSLLKSKGVAYEKDGALWFKSTAFGDDKDRVIIKSDGSYTYLTPDIGYHRDKFRRGFSRLINLWGPDHHGYISRIKAAIQALGRSPDSLSVIIVQLATVFREGKPLPMSTRRGQYITLREVLDEVGSDAARFFFLMRRTSAHLDFDLELAKKQTPENPVYYVQYAHARICSIIRKAPFKPQLSRAKLELLKEPEELKVIRKLWQFSDILQTCYKNIDPYFITAYLQEVAEVLHRFYERHRVLNEDESLTQARLVLISAARTVIRNGLGLLGISAPESM